MMYLQSLVSLLSVILLFTVTGLGVTRSSQLTKDFLLVPVIGFLSIVGLSYVLSANLHISGSDAVAVSILMLSASAMIRIRRISSALMHVWRDGELSHFLMIIGIPIMTLLIPAMMMGFKYFYGYVNFDFFYNSQDSWFLTNHHVFEFKQTTGAQILPLDWSSGYQGRFAVSILGAFFSKWMHLDVLQFNSLLLNSAVVLFALSMSVFSKEFFSLKKKANIIAVIFSVLSAAYVQAYTCYLLGQISSVPVFIVFCIFLKRFLDGLTLEKQAKFSLINSNILIMAVLLNILYIMYAILCFYAIAIGLMSYLFYYRRQINKNTLLPLAKILVVGVLLFCLVRIHAISESIDIIKGWILLSNKVASSKVVDNFIVFSEYLTESFLAILFGLVTYPSSNSIIATFSSNVILNTWLIFSLGMAALIIILVLLKHYITSAADSKAAHAVIFSLMVVTLVSAIGFFYTSASYALFKIQTWFMPVIIIMFVYGVFQKTTGKKFYSLVKVFSLIVLVLNLVTAYSYLYDFMVREKVKRFVGVHGITGNKAIEDLVAKLNQDHVTKASIFLTNGIEQAWIANAVRNISFDKVSHNYQPLEDRVLESTPCARSNEQAWSITGLMVLPSEINDDITDPPVGGKVLYKNTNYRLLDSTGLKSFIYFGKGAYPVEFYPGNESFPSKFRWVEKGIEVMVYSHKNRIVDLKIEVTPGFVLAKTPYRTITVQQGAKQSNFEIKTKTMLTLPQVSLKKGLNCFVVGSYDQVERQKRFAALIRPSVPLDPRFNNFVISHVGIQNHKG